jgi:hypothetical protein
MAVTRFRAAFYGAYAGARLLPHRHVNTGTWRNLGTFKTLAAAKKHERAVQFFKRQ